MYEAYWGLREKPFENVPDPRFLYLPESCREVYTRLLYALQGRRGALMLTGPSGCGKTLVARALLQELDPGTTEVALLTNPPWTREDFLREALYQLGGDGPLSCRAEVLHRLHEILYENHATGKETVVLIDEAQLIEDQEVLEEVRLLLNFQLNDAFLLTVLLVGQPAMAQRISRWSPLDQRIAARGAVRALAGPEVAEYIDHRLRTAGRREPIFTLEAASLIGEHCAGVPRRINNTCDIALVVGYSRKTQQLDADWVRRFLQAENGSGG
ncbi:MAG: AAA family ATPase [Candidatus Latescibacterota bacterium]